MMCGRATDISNSSFMESCCSHKLESFDDRDECSTIASDSEPSEPEDLEISDDEMTNDKDVASNSSVIAPSLSITCPTQIDHGKSRRTHWADIVDSDHELELRGVSDVKSQAAPAEETTTHTQGSALEKPTRVCWADLVDSDTETEQMAPTMGSGKQAIVPVGEPENHDLPIMIDRVKKSTLAKATRNDGDAQSASQTAGRGSNSRSTDRSGFVKGNGKGNAGQKGSGRGTAKGAGKGPRNNVNGKQQCQFIIGIEEDRHFRVVKRIIGVQGANMKRIAEETGVKLRLRGRGSKFLEGPEKKESTDDLMLCISAQEKSGYDHAVCLITELLQDVYNDYEEFCHREGRNLPSLRIRRNEGYREGSR
jgi:hypothetical protein